MIAAVERHRGRPRRPRLALACDLVLAADSAKFIEVFVRRGLVPDGGGAYLLPGSSAPSAPRN